MKCGKPLLRENEYCSDCTKRRLSYDKGFAVFLYNDDMKRAVGDFKYRNHRDYGLFFAKEMADRFGRELLFRKAELLVPVPVHPSRKRFRGYNQAEVLCTELSKLMNLPCNLKLLERTKKTIPQKLISSPEERLHNLETAVNVSRGLSEKDCRRILQDKAVVLVDDIYTTGSTAEACTRVLKKNGAKNVYILCICIGQDL